MGSGGAQGSHGPSVCRREEKGQKDGHEKLVPLLLLTLQLGEGPRGKEHGRRRTQPCGHLGSIPVRPRWTSARQNYRRVRVYCPGH